MNENADLIKLCRLNLMEDNIQDSPAIDRDVTLRAIDVEKRQIVVRTKYKLSQEDKNDNYQTGKI